MQTIQKEHEYLVLSVFQHFMKSQRFSLYD